jgi:hypothetical protein
LGQIRQITRDTKRRGQSDRVEMKRQTDKRDNPRSAHHTMEIAESVDENLLGVTKVKGGRLEIADLSDVPQG